MTNEESPGYRGPDLRGLGCYPRSWGEATNGPTLLCLHGLGDWGRSFETLAESSRMRGYRILAPDLPGYGESPRPAPRFSLQEMAESLAAALDRSGGTQTVLLGHSMGGTLSQLLAERRPDLFRAVVNVEGNVCLNDCSLSGPIAARSLQYFFASGLSELLSRLDESGREDPEATRYAETLRNADPAVVHHHAGDLVALSKPDDLARRFAALQVPTLYVAGSPGGIGPRSIELLRGAGVNLKVLSPAGHCPHLDLPETFAATLADFLGEAGIAPYIQA